MLTRRSLSLPRYFKLCPVSEGAGCNIAGGVQSQHADGVVVSRTPLHPLTWLRVGPAILPGAEGVLLRPAVRSESDAGLETHQPEVWLAVVVFPLAPHLLTLRAGKTRMSEALQHSPGHRHGGLDLRETSHGSHVQIVSERKH